MGHTIDKIFEDFNKLNVMIIGDVMVDSYILGKVDRISPEAPIPILLTKKREFRLGGAANVTLNIQALGATPMQKYNQLSNLSWQIPLKIHLL